MPSTSASPAATSPPSSSALSAGDIPLAVYAELQKMQDGGKQPDFNALMPQIQAISMADASLRFEDQSITKKVLPMIAAMQGMDEKTMIASVGPMMQMGLMQLQNQAFADQALAAVNAFLADPKSLTITAKPAEPGQGLGPDDDEPRRTRARPSPSSASASAPTIETMLAAARFASRGGSMCAAPCHAFATEAASRLRQVQPDVEFAQLLGRCFGGCAHQQVFGLLVHREEHDLADVGLVAQQHDDAVDAGAMPPWGGAPYWKARYMPPNFSSSTSSG